MALSCCKKKLSSLLHGATSEHNGDFIFLEQKVTLNLMKKYVKIQISVEL